MYRKRAHAQTDYSTYRKGEPSEDDLLEIVSLVAIILIPLVAVITLLAVNLANTKRQLIEVELVDIAGQVTTMADREVANTVGMFSDLPHLGFSSPASLRILRGTPRLWRRDLASFKCGPLTRTENRCRLHGQTKLPPLIQTMIWRVFAGHRVVSTVRGEGLKNATVVIAVPVIVDDRVIFGVAAEIHIDYLSKFSRPQALKRIGPRR